MAKSTTRAALLAASALIVFAMPGAAMAAGEATAADAGANSGDAADQNSSAGQAGQANDKQSLTSSDIIVTGSHTAETAPITASLTTTQPQAAVSREFIDNANAASDFNALIMLTPGVSITGNGNGAGLSETKAVIRGFQDGEYNVTYDSIPFADTNNPTHHSTAFFPSNTIETIVVDRGPGNASQLGQASYGGNLNLYSRAVQDEMGGQVEAILGNWNTFIARAEFQSGKIESLGGARVVLTGQYLRSDGALTFSPVGSKNLYGKAVIPVGASNTLTLMSTWNRNFYYLSDVAKGGTCGSATAATVGTVKTVAADASGIPLTQLTGTNCASTSEVGTYGKNFGMTNDPTLASYYKYNRTDKTTDFSYIRLQSELGSGFSLDNRAYMYGYTNHTKSGNGTSAVTLNGNVPVFSFPSGGVVTGFSGAGTAASPSVAVKGPTGDVLGYDKLNKYRVLGYIGQINYEFSMGKIRVGGWYEHADTDRHLFDLDMTTGLPSYNEKFNNGNGTAAQSALPSTALANTQYLQHSTWSQYQLFAEFEFRPIESLSITPGVKYVHFNRGIDAAVNQKSRTPIDTSATWTKTLPFATVNWQAMTNWSFYAQYAQGMYVPDLSSFYSASGTLSTALDALRPQTSTNYQVGTVWHGHAVSLDVDGYVINVDNKIGTCTTVGCDTSLLVNIGSVRYKGVEGEISYMPVRGLTLYANGSYNYAHSVTTGAQIAKAPFTTAAAGITYSNEGFRLSFNQKYVGPQYASEFSGSPGYRLYRIKPYSIGEFAISQEIGEHFRIGLNVSNVFNSRAVTAITNSASGAPTSGGFQSGYGQLDQFNFLPPRSFQVDARVKF
ncbi:TonB-dependent receptor [Novosphingobium sp. G106]|uniref:TonB-dependent receptor n=1 Tax=Novosphingobium sp. G106 TaxID=2849500 RepID=UPI001C2CD484|nr:TonB-dependent receptor [Novosphingobium sp. G106]MBV1691594.1 TonB-dependent receptor [Novosphingobium sp. G106]